MRTTTFVWIIILIILLGGGWYVLSHQAPAAGPSKSMGINGSHNQDNRGATSTGTDAGLGSTVGENLILGLNTDAKLGDYLSAFNGMTVYISANDKVGTSTCYGQCATNWPPYTVPSKDAIHVPATIKSPVNTITRADGSLQVTYKGMPLYFWKNDAQPGDTSGEGVNGAWHVAKP